MLNDCKMIIVKRGLYKKPSGLDSNINNSNKIQRQITKGMNTVLYNYRF